MKDYRYWIIMLLLVWGGFWFGRYSSIKVMLDTTFMLREPNTVIKITNIPEAHQSFIVIKDRAFTNEEMKALNGVPVTICPSETLEYLSMEHKLFNRE